MNSQAKGTGVVGYNVQAAVDAKHHLIVAHEVTNVGSDRAQLSKMALAAREAMGKTKLQALADRGYFNGTGDQGLRGRGHHDLRAQADDLEREGRGALRQERLHLHREGRRVSVPGRASARSTGSARGENGLQMRRLLDQRLPQVPDEGAVHDRATTDASVDGSTRRCSSACSDGWIASPTR